MAKTLGALTHGDMSVLVASGVALDAAVSAGTRAAPDGVGPWRVGARAASPPWRALSRSECAWLCRQGVGAPGSTLALLKVPEALFDSWQVVAGDQGGSFEESAVRVMKHPRYEPVLQQTIDFLRRLTRYSARPLRAFVAETHPGRASVCWDAKEFQGLHVDVRDKTPVSECAYSPTRFCLNIGRHSRGFCFLGMSVAAMVQELRSGGVELDRGATPQEVADRFMATFDSSPVVRVTLRPGEAYLAPTDNVVHDGYTEAVPPGDCDLVVMAIGYFDVERAYAIGSPGHDIEATPPSPSTTEASCNPSVVS